LGANFHEFTDFYPRFHPHGATSIDSKVYKTASQNRHSSIDFDTGVYKPGARIEGFRKCRNLFCSKDLGARRKLLEL